MGKAIIDPTYSEVKKTATSFEQTSSYQEYRRRWNENPKQFVVERFPIHVDIESTTVCNLKCPMCFQSFDPPPKGFIDFNLFKKIIDEGVQKGLCSIKLLYRGEPLLHPKIVEMVKYAKDKGVIEVMFNTNATLLNEKMARDLIEAGLDKIICSIDGYTKEVYEKIRVGAKFETLLNNLRNLKRLRKELNSEKPKIRIQMIDMPQTHDQIDNYIKFWGEIADDVAIEDLCDWNIKEEDHSVIKDFACAQLWQRLVILYNGDILLCCADHFKDLIVGNINDIESIEKLWTSEELNRYRNLHKCGESHKMKTCRICGLRKTVSKKLNNSEISELKTSKND